MNDIADGIRDMLALVNRLRDENTAHAAEVARLREALRQALEIIAPTVSPTGARLLKMGDLATVRALEAILDGGEP